jgi:hypothetical protein
LELIGGEKFLGRFAGGSINCPSSKDFELEDVPAKLQVKTSHSMGRFLLKHHEKNPLAIFRSEVIILPLKTVSFFLQPDDVISRYASEVDQS